jgi:hypothetical protein
MRTDKHTDAVYIINQLTFLRKNKIDRYYLFQRLRIILSQDTLLYFQSSFATFLSYFEYLQAMCDPLFWKSSLLESEDNANA